MTSQQLYTAAFWLAIALVLTASWIPPLVGCALLAASALVLYGAERRRAQERRTSWHVHK